MILKKCFHKLELNTDFKHVSSSMYERIQSLVSNGVLSYHALRNGLSK